MKTLRALEAEVGANILPMLISSLCDEIQTSLQHFDSYYKNQAWHSLEVESHALKSAALSFGAERLSQSCRDIEFAIKNKADIDAIAQMITDFKKHALLAVDHLKEINT